MERDRPALEGELRLARQQMASGHHDAALKLLVDTRALARSDEERIDLALATGDCLFALRDHAGAADEYFRARGLAEESDPETTWLATMGLARSRRGQGQEGAAERHFLEAVAIAERSEQRDRALLELARTALAHGDRAAAGGYLARIEDRHLLGLDELEKRLGPGTSAAAPTPPLDLPTVLAPEIIERSRWGARDLRAAGDPEPMERPWRITVHHSAEPERGPTDFEVSARQMRQFQSFHQDERGWADIGYHFVIDGAGRVFEGRELSIQGAHAGNRELNRGNIGVCVMGNFQDNEPTADQKKSLRRLLAWLCETERIHPRFIVGHRGGMRGIEKDTLCPGARLEAYLVRLIPFLPRP